jgi:class 3 adenylate cyclase
MIHPLTFLFTDLENSTPLWEQFPDEMQLAVTRHDTLIRTVIEQHRGVWSKQPEMGSMQCSNPPQMGSPLR